MKLGMKADVFDISEHIELQILDQLKVAVLLRALHHFK